MRNVRPSAGCGWAQKEKFCDVRNMTLQGTSVPEKIVVKRKGRFAAERGHGFEAAAGWSSRAPLN